MGGACSRLGCDFMAFFRDAGAWIGIDVFSDTAEFELDPNIPGHGFYFV